MFGHQEETAGAMEREGSLQNRGENESWLAATEPYRGARPRMRDFDRPVDEELGATAGEVEDSGKSPTMVLEETVGRLQAVILQLSLSSKNIALYQSMFCTLSLRAMVRYIKI